RVFLRAGTTWTEEALLVGAAGDGLGSAVALSADGGVALLAASGHDGPAADAGGARVFERSGTTWTERALLVASDGEAGDFLGSAVALSADARVALIGAAADDVDGVGSAGSARVFVRSGATWATWTEEATL